jgi:hypothetical protein
MLQPEILVGRAHAKFDAQGHLTDETTRTFLAKFLGAFRGWVFECLPADRWPGFGGSPPGCQLSRASCNPTPRIYLSTER